VVTASEKEHPVEPEVARASGLMQVNVTTTTVVGGQVKDDADPLERLLRNVLTAKVAVNELDSAAIDQVRDVLDASAAQVVDDSDARTASDQLLDKVRADERRATGDENVTAHPVQAALPIRDPLLRRA
jgi:hypothetical protein